MLITGGSGGIGRAIAIALVAAGAEVHITGRSAQSGEAAARELGCTFHCVDHSDLSQVRRFVARFLKEELSSRPLDVLVNNTAVMANSFSRTAEGHEQAIALNLLGMYALTTALLPSLELSGATELSKPGGRVVNVVSAGMYLYTLNVSDLRSLDDGVEGWAEPGGYDAIRAYSLTHRARVLLTRHWGEEQEARARSGSTRQVRFSSVHPGWVETPGLRGADAMRAFYKLTRPVLRSPAEGADTPVFLAAGMNGCSAPNGSFWYDRAPRAIDMPLARTAEPPEQLTRLLEFCKARTAE